MRKKIHKYKELLKPILIIFDQGLYSLTNLIIGMILARAVSKDSYGIYILIMSISTTIMGIQRAIVSVPYTVCKGDFKDEKNSYLASSNLFVSIIIMISSIFVILIFNKNGINNNILTFIIVYCFLVSILLKDYIRSYLLSHLKIMDSVVLGISINIIQIIGLIILFIASINNIVPYILIMACVTLTIAIVYCIKYLKCQLDTFSIKTHFINNFKFGKWILGCSIISSITSQSYPWMLSYFLDNESVATLGICIALGGLLNPIIQGVYSYMLPKITECRDNITKFKNSIILTTGILASVGMIWLITCILIGDKLMILLYSNKYSGLKIELVLAATSSIISGSTTCINAALDSLKKTDVAFGGLIVSFIVTLTLGVSFSYMYGIKGSLFAMVCSNIVNMIYRYLGLNKVLKEKQVVSYG